MLLLPLFVFNPAASPTTITYSHVAENCVDAISDLAKATGLKLRAAPAMKREILLISVQNASVADVMAKIATACDGVWELSGSTFILRRPPNYPSDPAAVPRLATVEQWERTLAFTKKMAAKSKTYDASSARLLGLSLAAKYEDALKKNPQMGASNARMVVLNNGIQLPLTTLAYQLLSAIPAKLLATIPVNQSRTFSNDPTGYEMQLPFDPLPLVKDALDQQSLISNAIPEKDKEDGGTKAFTHEQFPWADIKEKVAKVDVIVGYSNTLVPIRVLLEDAKGQPIRDVQLYTSLGGETTVASGPKFEIPANFSVAPGPEANALAAASPREIGGNGRPAPLSAEAIKLLSHPFDNEPLARYPSRVLIALGKAKNIDVIADMPDLFLYLATESRSVNHFLSFMLASQDPSTKGLVALSDKWLTINGGQLRGQLAFRDDRLELQHMLTASDDHILSLEQIISYKMKVPDTEGQGETTMGGLLAEALSPMNTSLTQGAPPWSWQIMRFGLGHVSPSGTWTMKLSDLPEDLKKVVSEATVYDIQDAYQQESADGYLQNKPLAETLNGEWENHVDLYVQLTSGLGAMNTPTIRTMNPQFFNTEELGQFEDQEKLGDLDPNFRSDLDKPLIPLTFRELHFNVIVSLPNTGMLPVFAQIVEVHPTGPAVTYENLPADIMAAIHAAAKREYNNMALVKKAGH